jgi:hypothetical protein
MVGVLRAQRYDLGGRHSRAPFDLSRRVLLLTVHYGSSEPSRLPSPAAMAHDLAVGEHRRRGQSEEHGVWLVPPGGVRPTARVFAAT